MLFYKIFQEYMREKKHPALKFSNQLSDKFQSKQCNLASEEERKPTKGPLICPFNFCHLPFSPRGVSECWD